MSNKQSDKKSSRIVTLDLMRGYFMIAIVLNHLQWYPNGLDWITMRGALFVSAAEGFFLLSGIVLGMVRGRKLLDKPFRVAANLLLKRGALLYITGAILTLGFMIVGWLFFMDNPGLKPGIRPIDEPLWGVILGILSFDYLYGWADFLRLYTIYLIASPLALWLIRKGKWYIVAIFSTALWLIFPWANTNNPQSAEILMVLSWQIIFFAGLIVGFYWQQIMNWWYKLSAKVRRPVYGLILATAAVTLVANIILEALTTLPGITLALPDAVRDWYVSLGPAFYKEQLPWPRLVLFGLWFILGFYIFKKFEKFFMKYLGWILVPFGQNSLYVYILHAVAVFFAHTLIMPAGASAPWFVSGSLCLMIIGLIYLAVRTKFLFKIIPR